MDGPELTDAQRRARADSRRLIEEGIEPRPSPGARKTAVCLDIQAMCPAGHVGANGLGTTGGNGENRRKYQCLDPRCNGAFIWKRGYAANVKIA